MSGFRSFNEDTRVKIPATCHFLRIGYQYQSLKDGTANIDFGTKIFINRFKPAVEKLNNRSFSDDEILKILADINNVIKNNDLGKEWYYWLLKPLDHIKLIDFDDLTKNDYAVVNELPYEVKAGTEAGSFRPDINILINGMPLCFLEVKKPNNEGGIKAEFDRMINQRLINKAFKKHFNFMQLVSFSNNMEYEDTDALDDADDVKAGSFYTTPNGTNTSFSFFREDDKGYHDNYNYLQLSEEEVQLVLKDNGYDTAIAATAEFQENLSVMTPCNRFITSVYDKERLLYLLKYGIAYVNEVVPQKHIMRYPQFFATRRIIERIDGGGKSGIIWHTQGSGKTALAAFSNRVINDYFAKKDINTRFFFIVDRLELLKQASDEFTKRNLHVKNCQNRDEFSKELSRPLSLTRSADTLGDICVVNIQKIKDDIPRAKNDYEVNTQRVFFIDEAHRSYSKKGDFFRNLMSCDLDGIYIALTGTPLLSKKERSNLKFGDYIHKYFYDRSIADGYTLRIKKESIDTVAKKEIRNNLELQEKDVDQPDVFESDDYINCLSDFIEKDFNNFRLQNADNTIGGMVVCRSNPQAAKVHNWFKEHSKLSTGLVIYDDGTLDPMQNKINASNQENFKYTNVPDMLIVNRMLTTGYDVKRLKKMYLLRGPKAQSLLQTISRVNRPYKSKSGKVYRYGYIVDFVDIEEEYDRTIGDYIKELEADFDDGEDEGGLNGLVIDKEDINKKYHSYVDELDSIIDSFNMERFSKQLTFYNKETLYKIRRLLNGIKECETEFILSRAVDYAAQIDTARIKRLRTLTQNRIDFVNLSDHTVNVLDVISNEDVVRVLYQFVKTSITIMDLGRMEGSSDRNDPRFKAFSDAVVNLQDEIKKNRNKDDPQMKKLDELLQKVFQEMDIHDLDDLSDITDELIAALRQAQAINDENDRLAAVYDGNFAFVKTYQDAADAYPLDRSAIEQMLVITCNSLKEVLNTDIPLIQGRKNFVDSIKKNITKQLLSAGIYGKVKGYYDLILDQLYTNIQLFR